MSKRRKNYYHNKGEKDASRGRHDPPHQGPIFAKDWWGSDKSGRPVRDKNKRENYDSYQKGHKHTRRQKDKGGCYLSTACVEHAGLPDDCHELQVLRHFRDTFVVGLPRGKAILEEYYRSAPAIVEGIRARADCDRVLAAVFKTVRDAVSLIEAGRDKEAFESYATTFSMLKAEYGRS